MHGAFGTMRRGGATLYAVDRVIRLVRRAPGYPTVRITVKPGLPVTEIVLPARALDYRAGQYAWINIPALSEYEWHPFTIASAPSVSPATFHIKSMGDDTFTGRLLEYAAKCDLSGSPSQTIRVDGPYGRQPYCTEYHNVLLVAGGIGITPMHAQLAEIHARASNGTLEQCALKRIRLVWVVREVGMLSL